MGKFSSFRQETIFGGLRHPAIPAEYKYIVD
jgi:hypothetical protein